jgi:hypothetical protein
MMMMNMVMMVMMPRIMIIVPVFLNTRCSI